ncbi:MAG TPA: cation acetate symporter [Solirubrobacteraceae bacterium]|nr:cation acetate symporter [Solirubrobacteraceae bacterium]
MTYVLAAELKVLPLAVFGLVLAVTLGITYWASKRTSTATEFWAAGRSVTGFQNGWAIAGDYMSASSFLGFAGLVFLFGVDAFVSLMAALVAFVPVLLFLAERMRNSGKYTLADVLSFRLRERPARLVAAIGTLAVVIVYLLAQMVGAGVLIQALTGVSFTPAVIVVGAFMLAYVIFGGMLATTWVQIIKAVLLMSAGVLLTVLVLAKVGFSPGELFSQASSKHDDAQGFLGGGLQFDTKLAMISFGIAFVLGTAGLPHILMRFFTVPDARAARGSVGWAVFLIGSFYLMVMIVGMGARAILGKAGEEAAGTGGNLAVPTLAETLGGGANSTGGEIFLAVISAVALATILAVVAGLVISASGAVAHDVWTNVVRKGRQSEREEVWVAKVAAAGIGILAIVLAIAGGAGFNVSVLVGMAFCVAASANFPALLLALFWERFNTTGAIVGMVTGVVASAVLIVLSAPVWPGPDSTTGSPLGSWALDNPAIYTIPLGFLGCWLGTVMGHERGAERSYHELYVRAETGLGAEGATGLTGRAPRARRAAGAMATQVLPK